MKVILRKGIPPGKAATPPPVVSPYVIFYLYDISCTNLRPILIIIKALCQWRLSLFMSRIYRWYFYAFRFPN